MPRQKIIKLFQALLSTDAVDRSVEMAIQSFISTKPMIQHPPPAFRILPIHPTQNLITTYSFVVQKNSPRSLQCAGTGADKQRKDGGDKRAGGKSMYNA